MDRKIDPVWRQYLRSTAHRLRACSVLIVMLMTFAVAELAQAQLLPTLPTLPATPPVQLPQLPANPANAATRQLDAVVNDATTELDTQAQRQLRAARIRALLRANPDTLEADPSGAPVLRSQVVSLAPTPQSLQAAMAAGFTVIQDQTLDQLNIRMVTLQAPPGMSIRRALQRLRALDREGSYDYNHVYTQSGNAQSGAVIAAAAVVVSASMASTNAPASASSADASTDTRIGLIDAGVDVNHPVFRSGHLKTWGCDQQSIPTAHGTAVASLLVGHNAQFAGAAPDASLYAADVYCGQAVGGSMTRIAAAMAWLAQQQVPVINVSLVGPDNILLKLLVRNLIAQGHIIVAAVGNDGPAAAPLYPAAYPNVVGVTAVDAHDRVLVEAGRGKQVDFAAPGADMAAAVLDDGYAAVRGTSFAAPLVAGLLSAYIKTPQPAAAAQAIAMLAGVAHDQGSRGVDKSYGNGVVGESLRVALAGLPMKSDKALTAVAPHSVDQK